MPKVAIIHDDFIQDGGAERLVAQMLRVFPQADIFTACYDKQVLAKLGIAESRVTASFLQKLPLKRSWYKALFFLYPLAFESLTSLGQLDSYQLAISSTTRFAHGVIAKPGTRHLVYLNSPGRAWWYPEKYFSRRWQARLFAPFARWLRFWDRVAIARADLVIANSKNIANKASDCYGRGRLKKKAGEKAGVIRQKGYPVIYPPVQLSARPLPPKQEGYFLLVSRLVAWKRVDIAVRAFRNNPALGKLVIVGEGEELPRLQRLAGKSPQISFTGKLTDRQLAGYYRKARALIVTQDEDFGMTVVEALASGTPVIAYGKGGAKEILANGKYGVLFGEQTTASLAKAVMLFRRKKFSATELKEQAQKFSFSRFSRQLRALAENNV